MKRILTTAVAMLVGVVLTLASVLALLKATLRVELIENAWLLALAVLVTLVGGVLLLLLSVFLYVRLAVFLFGGEQQAPPASPQK